MKRKEIDFDQPPLFVARRLCLSARRGENSRLISPSDRCRAAYIDDVEKRLCWPHKFCNACESQAMSDLRIKPFDFQAAVARAGLQPNGMPRIGGAGGGAGGLGGLGGVDEVAGAAPSGFRAAMADALKGVSQTQFQSEHLQKQLTLDNPNVSVEQTVMAMQKAQIGFQGVLQVRNRLAQAYSEIMNMQV
jgi:flagellar hook-basal body complex protein FliE